MDFNVDKRGVLLDERVSVDDLFALTPQYFSDYCKGIVNLGSKNIVVGMQVHRNGLAISRDPLENSYGFNVFKDGSIVYESGLNVPFNIANGTDSDDMRIITNAGLIGEINEILAGMIDGLRL